MPRKKKPTEGRSLENPSTPLSSVAAYDYLVGRRSSAGIAVNRETVLGYPAVWRCVSLISDKVGRLPLCVYRKGKDGGRTPDTQHAAWRLLMRQPSSLYTPFVFRKSMMASALITGNAYAWVIRDSLGSPYELVMLCSDNVTPVYDGGKLWYVVRVGHEERKLLPENILHIKGLCQSDGICGVSVVDVLREAFGIGLAAQRYGSTFYKNNASPGPTIIKLPSYLRDKEQLERFRSQWSMIHEGLDNSHRVAILENGADLVKVSIDHEASQFLQTREFEIKQVANIFGVPSHKLGADNSTSYGSLESEERAFLNDGLDGWLVQWEQECGSKLLATAEVMRDSHYIEFNRLALEQADVATQTNSLVMELNNGGISLNEYRSLRNRPGIGPDGDRFRIPANLGYIDDDEEDDQEPVQDQAADAQNAKAEEAKPADDQAAEEPAAEGSQDLVRSLLLSVLERYRTRLTRAALQASRKDDWGEWVNKGLDTHREVLEASIAPVTPRSAELAELLLEDIRQELAAVTRDQVSEVFSRLDLETWATRILRGK